MFLLYVSPWHQHVDAVHLIDHLLANKQLRKCTGQTSMLLLENIQLGNPQRGERGKKGGEELKVGLDLDRTNSIQTPSHTQAKQATDSVFCPSPTTEGHSSFWHAVEHVMYGHSTKPLHLLPDLLDAIILQEERGEDILASHIAA